MSDHGLGRWGEFLEAELTGLRLVKMHALSSGWISMPTSWIQGRVAEPILHLTAQSVLSSIDEVWVPDRVFYWREIPSIQFMTAHGSVIVTDLWGDSRFRTLRGVKARAALALDSPLIRAASRVEMLCSRGSTSPVLVTQVVSQEVEPLAPRARLSAWSSYAAGDEEWGWDLRWAGEENDYDRASVRGVLREFHAANPGVGQRRR